MLGNCIFYISPMYEFSHSLDPLPWRRDFCSRLLSSYGDRGKYSTHPLAGQVGTARRNRQHVARGYTGSESVDALANPAPSKAPTIQYCPLNAACIPVAPDIAERLRCAASGVIATRYVHNWP
jgi:hypothetical protein